MSYPAGSTYTLSSDGAAIILTAQWNANATITISFNSEGGSAVSAVTGLEGTTVTLPAAPTYAGYTFAGWFTAPSGGTALTSPYTLSASTTLDAQWSANPTITISFNSEGGSAVSAVTGLEGTTDHPAGGSHLRRLHLRRLVHGPLGRHGTHLALHPEHLHDPRRPVERQRHR